MPFCLAALDADPLAGEMFDGELVAAMKTLPRDYWRTHPAEEARFLERAGAQIEKGIIYND